MGTMLLTAMGPRGPHWAICLGASASLRHAAVQEEQGTPATKMLLASPLYPVLLAPFAAWSSLPHVCFGTSPIPSRSSSSFPLKRFFNLKDGTVSPSLVNKEKQTGTFRGAPSPKDKAGCCQGHRRDDIHLHSSPSPYSLSLREPSRFRAVRF